MTRLLDKARRSLGSAVLLLDTEDFDGAVNRAYYTDYGDIVQKNVRKPNSPSAKRSNFSRPVIT